MSAAACACPTCGQALPEAAARFDAAAGILIGGGRFAELSSNEAAMFVKLAERRGATVSREALMQAMHGLNPDDEPEMKLIDVMICKLRKKMKPLGIDIATAWGRGWRLVQTVEVAA